MERKPRKRKRKSRKGKSRSATRVSSAESDHYYVCIKDSVESRRKLLESSKDIIYSLKGYYQLLAIRRLKKEMMARLKRELKELTLILNKIEEDLPINSEREVRALFEKETSKQHVKHKTKHIMPPPEIINEEVSERTHHEMTKLQQLEQALKNVEGKLERL